MHRQKMHQLGEAIALAEALGARRLEGATVQFHGWEVANRAALMSTRTQARGGRDGAGGARADPRPAGHRLRAGRLSRPLSQAMHWRLGDDRDQREPRGPGSAETIPGLVFEAVRDRTLTAIRADGAAFRGTDWMQEPCRSCARRELDFGGCRCQAMALAGDPAATDPVCVKSPLHARVAAMAEGFAHGDDEALVWRRFREAEAVSAQVAHRDQPIDSEAIVSGR